MVPLLELEDLRVSFPIRTGVLRRVTAHAHAVDGVSLTLGEGETLGVVGESGCGKTSLARAVVGLAEVAGGQVRLRGEDIAHASPRRRQELSREIQMIFQDPYASLNPRQTVRQIVTAGWRIHPEVLSRERWETELGTLLETVGLAARDADRYPHQFSGGQRQRIGIARALALRPKLLVCDEPVSALDVSVQAQIVNLLADLQRELKLAMLFISHDLGLVRHLSTRVAVMYLGKVAETGLQSQVYGGAAHPYTQALLSAVRSPEPWNEPERIPIVLTGDVPSPIDPPCGCRFRTRCWKAADVCAELEPALKVRPGTDHPSACHFATTRAPVAAEVAGHS